MFTYASFSSEGERKVNEDCVGQTLVNQETGLLVLADGLGGHGRGEDASALATEVSRQIFYQHYREPDCLARCFEAAQNSLMQMQQRENAFQDLKTTLVLLSIVNGKAQWGHVGDSRLYYFKGETLQSRTLDHSVPQMLVMAGEIKESEIRHHPDRNRLIRVLGIEWDRPQYVISQPVEVEKGDRFLLCSDGFWENIEENLMIDCMRKEPDVDGWLARMAEIAYKNGKGTQMDNYSAVAVLVE